MKRFNTTGLCNSKKHYMVNISEKLEKIKALIENEEYFVINRPRQYGKTTTLFCLKKELLKKYLVISISFEGIGDVIFNDEQLFCKTFFKNSAKSIKLINKDISNKLLKYSNEVTSLVKKIHYLMMLLKMCLIIKIYMNIFLILYLMEKKKTLI